MFTYFTQNNMHVDFREATAFLNISMRKPQQARKFNQNCQSKESKRQLILQTSITLYGAGLRSSTWPSWTSWCHLTDL
jgi:hypothetical protein